MRNLTPNECIATYGGFANDSYEHAYLYSQLSAEERTLLAKLTLTVYSIPLGAYAGGFGAYGLASLVTTNSLLIGTSTVLGAAALGVGAPLAIMHMLGVSFGSLA
ncbi:MAG: hypothetical protein JSR17_13130 [Proteobacteria bacterium]|nr:hypothetical protein [Pseudomonadota bacterium]